MSDWEEESQPPVGYNSQARVETVRGKIVCECVCVRFNTCTVEVRLL